MHGAGRRAQGAGRRAQGAGRRARIAERYPPNGNTRRRGAGVKGEGISQHL